LRHRRDNGRIRRAEPRVNLMQADHSGSVNGHHVTAGFVSCAQPPSRPEGPAKRGGGAKRSALHGAEHSSKLSHVMAGGSSAARTMTDLLPEPGAMGGRHVRPLRRHIAGTTGARIVCGGRRVLFARVNQQSHQRLTLRAVV